MIQKIKGYLQAHPKEYELIRYLIAGVLATLLSMAIFSGFCMLVAPDHTVNGASPDQALIGNILSWVITVLFAFWTNRRLVFLRKGGTAAEILRDLAQFVLSRLVSGLLFEAGLFRLMTDVFHVSNMLTKLVVLVLVTVFNYVVSKFWIFSQKPQEEEKAAS